MKNIRNFYLKIFSFSEGKLSIYLNRHVFAMNKNWKSITENKTLHSNCRERKFGYNTIFIQCEDLLSLKHKKKIFCKIMFALQCKL